MSKLVLVHGVLLGQPEIAATLLQIMHGKIVFVTFYAILTLTFYSDMTLIVDENNILFDIYIYFLINIYLYLICIL